MLKKSEYVLRATEDSLPLMVEENEARLLSLATERMAHFDPATALDAEEVYRSMGITKEELDACCEVEFE